MSRVRYLLHHRVYGRAGRGGGGGRHQGGHRARLHRLPGRSHADARLPALVLLVLQYADYTRWEAGFISHVPVLAHGDGFIGILLRFSIFGNYELPGSFS